VKWKDKLLGHFFDLSAATVICPMAVIVVVVRLVLVLMVVIIVVCGLGLFGPGDA
jgi:hypothetical protein